MEGIIYRAYMPSGISYIGQTTQGLKKRINCHWNKRNDGNDFHALLKLYGREGLCWEVLETCDESLLSEREIYWINYFDSYENGLNDDIGGKGTGNRHNHYNLKEETKKKMSDSSKGKPKSEQHKEALTVARRKRNAPASEETRRKCSESNKGRQFNTYKHWKLVDGKRFYYD